MVINNISSKTNLEQKYKIFIKNIILLIEIIMYINIQFNMIRVKI